MSFSDAMELTNRFQQVIVRAWVRLRYDGRMARTVGNEVRIMIEDRGQHLTLVDLRGRERPCDRQAGRGADEGQLSLGGSVRETRHEARRQRYAGRVMTEKARNQASRQRIPSRAGRAGWATLALFLAAFAVFESFKYGLATSVAALAFFALADAARLARLRESGLLYQAVHRAWIPLAVLIVYTAGPIVWPPLFTAALGWLTRISVDRALLRTPRATGDPQRRP